MYYEYALLTQQTQNKYLYSYSNEIPPEKKIYYMLEKPFPPMFCI